MVEGASAQGGEQVPVPQEAPIVLAWVHDEPTQEPAPRLLSEGLLDFPLGHVVTDVYQLDQEDVGHAGGDNHRVPHTGEGQGRAGGRMGASGRPVFSHSESIHCSNISTHAVLGHLPQLLHWKTLFYPQNANNLFNSWPLINMFCCIL